MIPGSLNTMLLGDPSFEVENSGLFVESQSDDMSLTFTGSPLTTWTFSGWVSAVTGGQVPLISCQQDTNNRTFLQVVDGNVELKDKRSGSTTINIEADNINGTVGVWYHYHVIYDSTESTAADRYKVTVDGVLDTSYTAPDAIGLNETTLLGDNISTEVGSLNNGQIYADANFAEVYFFAGDVIEASEFGEDIAGTWTPKQYTGAFSGDDFYLEFKNSGDLGEDSSGLGNDFTNSGVTQSTDVPPE